MKQPELAGKRLLVLGGSLWKDAIKDFAVGNDITIIATGNDQSAGIFEIADESYSVDSTDEESMKKLIKSAQIDGVYMGGSESVIVAASKYLNDLGLPCYCTNEQWNTLQNKKQFKELCVQHNLPVAPRFESLDSVSYSDYPVITKPSDGCGSSGFSVCNNESELKEGYEIALRESPTDSVIIEKYVPNNGVVVFYTVSNGNLYYSGLEDKYPVRYEKQGSYVGGLFICESSLACEFRTLFESKIEQMIHSIGIEEGSFWIEVFHTGNEYYFNEVGFRYGGSASIYFIDYLYGINQVAKDIYYALTGKSKTNNFTSLTPSSVPKKNYYAVYPVYCKSGTINSIAGLDAISKLSRVVKIPVMHNVGSTIIDSGSFSQAVALVHFVFDNKDELLSTLFTIQDSLVFADENGNNLVLNMLDINNLELKI